MKQIELNLQKRLLIVEVGEIEEIIDVQPDFNIALLEGKKFIAVKGNHKLIGKGSELTEEIANTYVSDHNFYDENRERSYHGYKDYKHNDYALQSALESFTSAIEAQGYYWSENPIEKPTMEKYGWYTANSQEEESGWMYEEGEDKYYEALNEWQNSESKTFNPSKTLIFEILL